MATQRRHSLPAFPHNDSTRFLSTALASTAPLSPIHEHLIPLPLRTYPSKPTLNLPLFTSSPSPTYFPSPSPSSSLPPSLSSSSHSPSPSPSSPRPNQISRTYICTLCHTHFRSPPYSLSSSSDGRVFCRQCFLWAYDVGICWSCTEMVVRGEGRVSFGWCFWHWGCFACLFCKVGWGFSFKFL